ncbi:MAG: hypothetical protein ACI9WU_004634, partial [Myxococcota bacterium]
VKIPEAQQQIAATSQAEIDEALGVLQAHKQEWADLSLDARIALLGQLRDGVMGAIEGWIAAACKAKGIARGSHQEGEEWLAGPTPVIRNINLLIKALEDVKNHGAPRLPSPAFVGTSGQVVAPVVPVDNWDKLLFTGFSAEVWMEPGVTLANLTQHQAAFYKQDSPTGKVALVLGAGNVSSIGPMDALYKLFVEGQVVLVKTNPVNEYLGPFWDESFAVLRDRGFFRVAYGGALEGDYLCQHDLVDEIHITGSDKTHDAIVFGVGEDGDRRKSAKEPRNDKPITSELGNVSPMIIVPGPWSQSDLDFHGVNLASSLCNNAGFNCNATRVIIQHEGWDQREGLLDATRRAFDKTPQRKPYYPGARDRHETFVGKHPKADQYGTRDNDGVPWTLISHLNPDNVDDICFNMESWCGVTSEVALPAKSVADYIDAAVAFCNDRVWGSLNAGIIVHPKSLKDPTVKAAVDRAIANLRAGAIGVNHWPALAYAFVSPTWGAFPGHDLYDIRSGRGVVHNTYLFDRPQKSVVRGPFRVAPRPIWFVDHKQAAALGRKVAYFNADPSIRRIPSILWSAIRG